MKIRKTGFNKSFFLILFIINAIYYTQNIYFHFLFLLFLTLPFPHPPFAYIYVNIKTLSCKIHQTPQKVYKMLSQDDDTQLRSVALQQHLKVLSTQRNFYLAPAGPG